MNSKKRIVVTNPLYDEVRRRLEAHAHVDMNESLQPWAPDVLAAKLRSAHALMGFMTDSVDEALLTGAPQLEIVACALKGYDAYDVEACTRHGVWLTIVPDLLTEPTAELAMGLALALARHVKQGDTYVRADTYTGWRAHLYGMGLRGSTVAVLGAGRVGSAIINRLQGFECARILSVDATARHHAAEPATLNAAMAAADFVFVALPLTASTRHLVNAAALGHGKRGQLLINVGRGSVVDETAVAAALAAGQLGGYAADVFECEDWGLQDRPTEIPQMLLQQPNTLFTPHLGSAVRDVRLAIEHRTADSIIAVLNGEHPGDAINQPQLLAA